MKFALVFLASVWLLCGAVGAWWDGHLNRHHLKDIAKGPITLIDAYSDSPPSFPGPG